MRGWETARIHFPPSSDPSSSRRVGSDVEGKLVALAVAGLALYNLFFGGYVLSHLLTWLKWREMRR